MSNGHWSTSNSQYGQSQQPKQYSKSEIRSVAPQTSFSSSLTSSTIRSSDIKQDVQKRMAASCITPYSPKIQAVCSKLIEKSNIIKDTPSQNTIGYGLANIGQTCYMNSVLQVLFHLRNGELMKQLQSQIEATEQFVPSQQLLFLLVLTRNLSSKQIVDYDQMCEVKDVVDIFATNFRGTAQQCSHEFFAKIRELLHDSLCRGDPKQLPALLAQIPQNLSAANKCLRTWDCFNAVDSSIISDYFRGQYLRVVDCNNPKCLYQTYQCDIFHDLQLHIPPTATITRSPMFASQIQGPSQQSENLLDYFKFEFKAENLRDGSCQKCRMQGITLQTYLFNIPDILTTQIVRFDSNNNKKHNKLFIPLTLNIDFLLFPSQKKIIKKTEYNLKAVINHYGPTLSQGHYTTTLRDFNTGNWYVFNDDQIFNLEKKEAERMFQEGSETAYILFYELIK